MNLLEEMIANKREEIAGRKKERPTEAVREAAARARRGPGFVERLTSVSVGLIAEVKRRSPSAGVIRSPFDPARIAEAYEKAGVQAISVLMDEKYFGGGESDFCVVRSAVGLPLLYKEFVVDPWQVWHAAALGASAILLIASALTLEDFGHLFRLCAEADIEALVEVHQEEDVAKIARFAPHCVGINNRDLKTFETALETTFELRKKLPQDCVVVSESGIHNSEDVVRLKAAGARAILVGESLLRQADPGQAVKDLMIQAWK